MCGICGVVDFTGRPIDPATILEMRDVMVRRGPDAAGIRMLPKVGLGHRRLSIIDLSESGHALIERGHYSASVSASTMPGSYTAAYFLAPLIPLRVGTSSPV